MQDRTTLEPHASLGAEPAPVPTSPAEVWRMLAPWLGYAFLAAAGVLGLTLASGAGDRATYAAGLGTFIVASILVAVRMKRQLDGTEVGFLLPVSAADWDTLAVTIAVLTVLGLAGIWLAAVVGGALYAIGLALFAVSAGLIFFEIKRFFDRSERAGHGGPRPNP